MYEIKSSNYIKDRTVLIDGITVTMRAPGAGSELAFNQTQRRLEFLDKKLAAGTITTEELDLYDKLEAKTLGYFDAILRDGSADNAKIKDWLDKTPMGVIEQAFKDMKQQFEQTDAKVGDATVEA